MPRRIGRAQDPEIPTAPRTLQALVFKIHCLTARRLSSVDEVRLLFSGFLKPLEVPDAKDLIYGLAVVEVYNAIFPDIQASASVLTTLNALKPLDPKPQQCGKQASVTSYTLNPINSINSMSPKP